MEKIISRNLGMLEKIVSAYFFAHQIMKLISLQHATVDSGKSREKLLPKKDREEIGEYVRRSLGLLYTNMISSINEREQRERDFGDEMAKKFV